MRTFWRQTTRVAQDVVNRAIAEVDVFFFFSPFTDNTPTVALVNFGATILHLEVATQHTDATCGLRGFGAPVHPGEAEVQDH